MKIISDLSKGYKWNGEDDVMITLSSTKEHFDLHVHNNKPAPRSREYQRDSAHLLKLMIYPGAHAYFYDTYSEFGYTMTPFEMGKFLEFLVSEEKKFHIPKNGDNSQMMFTIEDSLVTISNTAGDVGFSGCIRDQLELAFIPVKDQLENAIFYWQTEEET